MRVDITKTAMETIYQMVWGSFDKGDQESRT